MNHLNQIISLRLDDYDRSSVQTIATRLYVRESDVYRFSVNYMLNRFGCLLDNNCTGSDLLLSMLDIRVEISQSLGFKKNHLDKIINGNNLHPEKLVAMSDIELLLLPSHMIKQRLMQLDKISKNDDPELWLKEYLIEKYNLK